MNAHPSSERRHRRSDDPITALHYQLASSRQGGGFDAIVLVDDVGALVAGAGAWPVCEELAAFAPLLADPERLAGAPREAAVAISPQVALRTFSVDGAPVVLAGRGACEGIDADAWLRHAASGCARILNRAA